MNHRLDLPRGHETTSQFLMAAMFQRLYFSLESACSLLLPSIFTIMMLTVLIGSFVADSVGYSNLTTIVLDANSISMSQDLARNFDGI